MVETVLSCLLLLVFFFACVGVWQMVRDKLYLERIARDGAREAVMVGSLDAGRAKAEDRARQFFGSRWREVQIDLTRRDEHRLHYVTCTARFTRPLVGPAAGKLLGVGEVTLGGKAVFGWKDLATSYE